VSPGPTASRRRIDWIVFVLLLGSYAYFFQGGGWNQNSRFDQVRAIVESGRLSINDHMLYRGVTGPDGRRQLKRIPLAPGTPLNDVGTLTNTEDVVQAGRTGLHYPNKPPGAVFLALPGYLVIHAAESAADLDPDDWRVMTLNHYVATLFSVGLIGALGGLLLLRTSRELLPELPEWTHAASALSCGLGTLMLPYSTMLFDHVAAAVSLLASFYCLTRAGGDGLADSRRSAYLLLAGAAAGMSVVVNYVTAGVVLLLAIYAVRTCGFRPRTALFLLGGLPFALALAGYHTVCFGSPIATANQLSVEGFRLEGKALGSFGLPQPGAALKLLFGTRRGLFLTSPVLLFALGGAVGALRRRRTVWAAGFSLLVFGFYLVMNSSFEHWHAGYALGPRYLTPALPLLGLWLALAFAKLPRAALAVAAISVLILLLATAVDAQPPTFSGNPLVDHHWPLVSRGAVTHAEITIEGPVSANPIGTWEGWYYRVFPIGSPQARWSSFNLGELLWPRSLLSLLPLAAFLGLGILALTRETRVRRS
jgi:hypothetical protein